jgi:hypothetical protein
MLHCYTYINTHTHALQTFTSPRTLILLHYTRTRAHKHLQHPDGYEPCEQILVSDVYIMCFYFAMTTLTTVSTYTERDRKRDRTGRDILPLA